MLSRRSRRASDSELQYRFLARMGDENREGGLAASAEAKILGFDTHFQSKRGIALPKRRIGNLIPNSWPQEGLSMGPVMPGVSEPKGPSPRWDAGGDVGRRPV